MGIDWMDVNLYTCSSHTSHFIIAMEVSSGRTLQKRHGGAGQVKMRGLNNAMHLGEMHLCETDHLISLTMSSDFLYIMQNVLLFDAKTKRW